jgi:hypothetical protein
MYIYTNIHVYTYMCVYVYMYICGMLFQPLKGMKFWYMLKNGWTWEHLAKWNKLDAKRQILYDSSYVNHLEQANSQKWK